MNNERIGDRYQEIDIDIDGDIDKDAYTHLAMARSFTPIHSRCSDKTIMQAFKYVEIYTAKRACKLPP